MRLLVLLLSFAMPVVSWFSQRGAFGPTNGAISDQTPTLIVAAGYAFAVWGLIFLLDMVFGIWQARPRQADNPALARVRPLAAAGFLLTAAWMPIFSQQLFWLALGVIWTALACLLASAILLARAPTRPGQTAWAKIPLSLHAGWLSLAAFLNTAQALVVAGVIPAERQLPATLWLYGAAAALLLAANTAMRGSLAYAAIALWGLVAVYREQAVSPLAGAQTAAHVAAGIAVVLVLQTVWLRARRRPRRRASDR